MNLLVLARLLIARVLVLLRGGQLLRAAIAIGGGV
jgi:hypothetical protein